MLRAFVPAEEFPKLEPGSGWEVQLLKPDRTIDDHVGLDIRLRGKAGHPVPHLPANEAEQEVLLPEIEETVVVRGVGLLREIIDPDRVVSEPLPDRCPRAHSHEVDSELGAWKGVGLAGPRRRGLAIAGG